MAIRHQPTRQRQRDSRTVIRLRQLVKYANKPTQISTQSMAELTSLRMPIANSRIPINGRYKPPTTTMETTRSQRPVEPINGTPLLRHSRAGGNPVGCYDGPSGLGSGPQYLSGKELAAGDSGKTGG